MAKLQQVVDIRIMSKKPPSRKKRGPYRDNIDDLTEPGTAGMWLKQWRFFRNRITIEELAEKAGLSTGTISGIERKSVGFSHTTLLRLARALGTTASGLFLNPLDNPDLWTGYDRLSDEQRQRIIERATGVAGFKKI